MSATETKQPRIIPLSKHWPGSRYPTDFLLVDVGPDGQVRVAHWWVAAPNEAHREVPPQQPFDRLVADGIISNTSSKSAWCRAAAQRDSLDDALYVALQESRHEWRTVLEYLRATGWGAELP